MNGPTVRRARGPRWVRVAPLVAALLMVAPLLVTTPSASAAGPSPGTVVVMTRPALGGVRLLVGPTLVVTGAAGSASVWVPDINGIASKVRLASTRLDERNTLALATVVPTGPRVSHESHLSVGLDVTSSVTLRVLPGASGVAASTVHQVRLHSVTGETLVVDPTIGGPVALLSRKSRYVAGLVQSQVVTWTVDSLQSDTRLALTTERTGLDPFSNPVWELTLQAVSGVVDIQTVPVTPDATFVLDGSSVTTDATGAGRLAARDLNGVTDRLRLASASTPTSAVAITRVARLTPTGPFERNLLVALAVRRPVWLTFRDPRGRPVPASRVDLVELSGAGQVRTLTGGEVGAPVSLLSEQARLVNGTWQAQPVSYVVTKVSLDGANAVFSGQQRFDAAKTRIWPIEVSVYDLRVSVRDVILGHLVGSRAWVGQPDGERTYLRWSTSGPTQLHALVRGTYVIHTNAAVLGSDARVLVSRSDDVQIRVVTALDVAMVAMSALALAAVLIVLGRLAQRRRKATGGGGDG